MRTLYENAFSQFTIMYALAWLWSLSACWPGSKTHYSVITYRCVFKAIHREKRRHELQHEDHVMEILMGILRLSGMHDLFGGNLLYRVGYPINRGVTIRGQPEMQLFHFFPGKSSLHSTQSGDEHIPMKQLQRK